MRRATRRHIFLQHPFSWAAAFAVVLLVSACAKGPDIALVKAGLSEKKTIGVLGALPDSRRAFTITGNPSMDFTVLEYDLTKDGDWRPIPYWILLDDDGVVTFGKGGFDEARIRASDTYYAWMAEAGRVSRAEAERKVYELLREIYGSDLNINLDAYMRYRIATMAQVDAGGIAVDRARKRIRARLAALRPRGSDMGRGPASPLEERAQAIALLGVYGGAPRPPRRPVTGCKPGKRSPGARCF